MLLIECWNEIIDTRNMSNLLYDLPDKLNRSVHQTFWTVFWSSGYAVDSTKTRTLSSSNDEDEAIKWKIKSALEHCRNSHFGSVLVQFWAPTRDGSQIFLSTSDLPFGLDLPFKGLCLYRKQCMQYKYVIGGNDKVENQSGPPGRVFCHGRPEYNPYVVDYSIEEYPLRDQALSCGATTYLALPVFESLEQHCAGVLEVLAFSRPAWRCTPFLEKLYTGLKAVGLKLPDDSLSSLDHDVDAHAIEEIKVGLEKVCKTHNLPLAQLWMARGIALSEKKIFCIRKKLSFKTSEKISSFVRACGNSWLRNGEGVVGKAFASFTSCFCKDITRLDANDYSLVRDAREVNLTSCFAISLRSFYTGYANYIIEFFLPTSGPVYKEPQTFLDSLLVTVKHHFQSFRIACGLDLGEELSVEVLRLPEDDSFKVCQTTKSPLGPSCSPDDGQNTELHSPDQQLALGVDAITDGRDLESLEQHIVTLPHPQEFQIQRDPPFRGLSLDINAVCDEENSVCEPEQRDVVTPLEKEEIVNTSDEGQKITLEEKHALVTNSRKVKRTGCKHIRQKSNTSPPCKRGRVNFLSSTTAAEKPIKEDCSRTARHSVSIAGEGNALNSHPIPQLTRTLSGSSMTVKAKYGADMIKFELLLSSTMVELVDKVTKRFKLQADTFGAKYLNEDNDFVVLASDEDLQKCMSTMKASGGTVVRIEIEPNVKECAISNKQTAEAKSRASVAYPIPQLTSMQNESSMTIKARYGSDMIKVELLFSATMAELIGEVTKRFRLQADKFQTKYLSEDDVSVLLASDEDLQKCMRAMKASGKTLIRVDIEPIAEQPAITKKHIAEAKGNTLNGQNGSSMTIKAKYGADMIKFELLLSSTMVELVDKVTKRIKLQANMFKAKYLNEDNESIVIASDEDLQKCMRTKKALGKSVICIYIEPNMEQLS